MIVTAFPEAFRWRHFPSAVKENCTVNKIFSGTDG